MLGMMWRGTAWQHDEHARPSLCLHAHLYVTCMHSCIHTIDASTIDIYLNHCSNELSAFTALSGACALSWNVTLAQVST